MRWLAALMALAVFAFAGRPAAAADEPATLRAVPDQIALQPGLLSQDILLLLQPPKAATVRNARLRWLPPAGLDVKQLSEPAFPTASDAVWTLRLTAGALVPKDASVVFYVEYEVAPAPTTPATMPPPERSATLTATVRVAYTALTLPQSLKLSLERGFDALVPNDPKLAYLVVDNSDVSDIALDKITVVSPVKILDVTACPSGCSLPITIPARSIRRVSLQITAKERIPPGSTPMLLDLDFSRKMPGGTVDQTTIGFSEPIQLAIPGLADVTKILQVPSLLFLPGVLVMLVWGFLWRRRHPATDAPEFLPKPTTGEFYVASITLSIVIAYGYSRFVIGETSGLLEAVSMKDIAVIWFGCVIGSAVVYYAIALIAKGWRASRSREATREELARNPQLTDEPRDILQKVAARTNSLNFAAYTFADAGRTQRVFRLGFDAAGSKTWVCPVIRIAITEANAERATELKRELDPLLTGGNLTELLEFLRGDGHTCTLSWETGALCTRPMPLEIARLGTAQGSQALVERR